MCECGLVTGVLVCVWDGNWCVLVCVGNWCVGVCVCGLVTGVLVYVCVGW